MKLNELGDNKLVAGTRIIYSNRAEGISYHSNVKETEIVEVSPSNKYIKLADYGWTLLDNTVIDVLEVLHE